MTLLNGRGIHGVGAFPCVPVAEQSVVAATNNNVRILGVVLETDERRAGNDGLVRCIRVLNIPDVGIVANILLHLLKVKHGVGHGHLVSIFRVPRQARRRSLDRVRVAIDNR